MRELNMVRKSRSRDVDDGNECPRKEWRGGREKGRGEVRRLKGSVDNLEDLEERKEKERRAAGDTSIK